MDILILALGTLGLALAGTGITGLAFVVAQQVDYHIALHNWAMRQASQQQASSKRVIEIHIS